MFIIKTIPKFLSENECSELINQYSNLSLQDAEYYSKDEKLIVNKKVRDSKIIFVSNELITKKIIDELKKHISIKGYNFIGLERLQFTKYDFNGHYDWHVDSNINSTNNRYYSIVIPLNIDYENGELLCKDLNDNIINLEKKTGNLHIFSSTLLHKVTNVTCGVRYSLVTWLSLEKIKDFKKSLI
jgi:predicted 2-oxoglutarate/Fe(II)-dependent dioxygenase YbiX